MTYKKMVVRRREKEGVLEQFPQGDQVCIKYQVNEVAVVPPDITNGEIRYALLTLTRVITTHVARDVEPRVNALDVTMTSRLGDFVI